MHHEAPIFGNSTDAVQYELVFEGPEDALTKLARTMHHAYHLYMFSSNSRRIAVQRFLLDCFHQKLQIESFSIVMVILHLDFLETVQAVSETCWACGVRSTHEHSASLATHKWCPGTAEKKHGETAGCQ